VRPHISGTQAIWWLGGGADTANNYHNSTQLTANANGAPGTAYWTVVSGPVTMSCSACGVTTITSTGPSADCTFDVGIKISYGGFESNLFTMNVNRPRRLVSAYQPYGNPTSDSSHADGYISNVNYISADACGYAMTSIALNEQFGQWSYNNPTYNWNHPTACYDPLTGLTQCPSGYSGWVWPDRISHFMCSVCTPPVSNPQTPLSSTGVDYAPQTWRLGSNSIGAGVIVQTNTIQRYVDHGRHVPPIVSPVGP
jgi:hypothetical protein